MCLLTGKAGFVIAALFAGLTLNIAAFGQSNGPQPPQAPSSAPLTARPARRQARIGQRICNCATTKTGVSFAMRPNAAMRSTRLSIFRSVVKIGS